jgi:hypothetical protein
LVKRELVIPYTSDDIALSNAQSCDNEFVARNIFTRKAESLVTQIARQLETRIAFQANFPVTAASNAGTTRAPTGDPVEYLGRRQNFVISVTPRIRFEHQQKNAYKDLYEISGNRLRRPRARMSNDRKGGIHTFALGTF